jgi:hypothetical protein
MNLWWELVGLVSTIDLPEEEDTIICTYNSSWKYTVQSLYAIVNFRGITLVFVSSVWKLNISLRVQFFPWLLSNNKLLTRDNLAKREGGVSDPTCPLCAENKSINHLFFECCIVQIIWKCIYELLNLNLG